MTNPEQVINEIRKFRFNIGLDVSTASDDIKRSLKIQKDDKEKSARLIQDIYTKKPHFILELIQNAEDNQYSPDVEPQLHLKFDRNKLWSSLQRFY